MREAARALDDVSDHLGEVLRRADELLVEWSTFAAQVRGQVEREAAAVGHIVEGAVGRVAAQGIDRAIGERLRALTLEIERLEQRTRAASRAVVEQRDRDRRLLWAVVAGIALANALLVVLVLRKPAGAPAAEPIRLESTSPQSTTDPAPSPAPAEDPAGATVESQAPMGAPSAAAGASAATGAAGPAPAGATPSSAGQPGGAQQGGAQQGGGPPGATRQAGAQPGGAQQAGAQQGGTPQGGAQQGGAQAPSQTGSAASSAARAAGSGAHANEPAPPRASPMAYPPRPGAAHPHKKLP